MSVDNTTVPPQDSRPSRLVYGIFQTGQLLALPAYVFVIGSMLGHKNLRQTPANLVIITLLLVNFIQTSIDQSLLMNYLRTGAVTPASPSLCLFWLFVDAYTFDTGILLMCWASIERHILVFHSHWLGTRRSRILLHYAPLMGLLTYTFSFFVYAMFFFPCENNFDYTAAFCGYACFYSSTVIVAYESLAHEAIPILLIAVFSVALLVRFVAQKRRHRQAVNQRKFRKMTIQLLTVASLYFCTNFPYTINPIATFIFNVTPISDDVQRVLLNYISAILPIALPYICLGLLPNLRQKLCGRLHRGAAVGPTLIRSSKFDGGTRQ